MKSPPEDPLFGDPNAAWRHAERYDPDKPSDAGVLADLAARLGPMDLLDAPLWVLDVERSQLLWANPPGLAVWSVADLEAARRVDVASTQSDAVHRKLMDTLARVRIGEPSSSWVTLSPSGSVRRYLLRYHPVALSDGRDALLVEAMAEPEADAWMALASDQRLTVALYALSGELLSGNPRFTELYEHNPSLARLSGLLSSEPRGTALADALTREPELRGRGPLQTARGERRFSWEARLSPSVDGPPRVLVSLFDQTERRVAEAEQARGALLELSLDAIIIVDEQGRVVEFNPAAEELFGYSRKQVLGERLSTLIIPHAHRAAHEQGMKHHQETGEGPILGQRLELPALRADGTTFQVELVVVEHVSGGRRRFIGFLRDIDALRKAEAQVFAERARFSSVFEHAPDPIVILDGDGEVLQANRACEHTLGWSVERLPGQRLDALLRPWPAAGEPHWGTHPTHELQIEAGQWAPAEVRSSPFQLDGVEHRVVRFTDLRRPIAVAQERDRLAQMAKEGQRLQELGTLAGGVAHYFNNLLAAVLGNIELLQPLAASHSEAQGHLDELVTSSERGKEMVRRILAFSRQAPPVRAPEALEPIAKEALALVRAAFPGLIDLQLAVPGPVPLVDVNATQMHQVLVNLLTNACQAVGAARGRVEVRIQVTDLPLPAGGPSLTPGRYVRVDVADDGPGMDKETAARAFQPFFTTRERHAGTGLGLAEVHGVVADHGGAVSVRTAPGAGCVLSVFLPVSSRVSPPASAPAAAVDPAAPDPLAGLRLLFVDDERALCRLVPRLLRRDKVAVTTFTEPLAALEHFRGASADFDVVMTDISMPQMSGLEFARSLSSVRADIPVLFASGGDLSELGSFAVENPTATIGKPYMVRDLRDALRALARRRGRSGA